jgi:allophanate hydrolase
MKDRMSVTVGEIVEAHRAGTAKPEETVADYLRRIREHDDPAIFISVADEAVVLAQAREAARNPELPLCGVPVAIKDNIDAAGFPTTAACPAFSYMPERDSTVVAKLKAAGAIVVGKTNLDQFATGLVGVRSPYGVPRNPFNAKLIPGGSSSGSAVAVSAGLVPLALGTDTAGSGRVPAGLNNIVGLKPSLGLVSTFGVVPACRSLDCVSIFSLTADDAWTALGAISGFDDKDAYSRALALGKAGVLPPVSIVGIPRAEDRLFFGDKRSEAAFELSIELVKSIGARIVELDFSYLLEAARLLYGGPWVAERTAAVGGFIDEHPSEIFPVTREIISGGGGARTVDAFRAFYRMQELRALARKTMAPIDILMVPTVPAAYTVSEIESDPIRLNANLGTYTNFVNLMDLCGLAVPATFAADGTPYGVTFLGRAGEDAKLLSLGRAFHAKSGLRLGALEIPQPSPTSAVALMSDEIEIAVVGAHMSGMALNSELSSLGARFLRTARTAPDYRLFLLDGPKPARPGLLRIAKGEGSAIEIEIWAMRAEAFGTFVSKIPAPLSIGTVAFEDNTSAKCFLVEAESTRGVDDISTFGGWRNYMNGQRREARSEQLTGATENS